MIPPAPDQPPRGERAALIAVFAVALALHFFLVTRNWTAGFLPGHEFRQTQTALIAHYIGQDGNFSLRYETPLLGKPWVSFPLELPLYEWSVVGLSRATGLPHHESARTISLACFYLMLPAIWLLLGEAGLAPLRRLPALVLILTCPVYIFYSRAFLMESMALMFAAWFLLAFVRTLRERRWCWLLLCTVAGTAAGVQKSTTFFVWLLPAAIFGAWSLWRSWRGGGGKAALATIGWGLGAVAVPGAAVWWWVRFTDVIKAAHPSAYIFTSHNLSAGNFGMFSLAARFSPVTWRALLERWGEAIMAPWLIGLLVLAGAVLVPGQRRRALGAAALFLAAQSLFPYAYAYQEYYFYACAVFLLCALGCFASGLLDSPRTRWLAGLLLLVPVTAQLHNYWGNYRVQQNVQSNGGSGLADALRAYTPPGSVLVIAGSDWSAVIPYYAQRRALMIRNGLEQEWPYVERAFADLHDEEVGALVLAGSQRGNRELVRRAAARFNLDPDITFSHPTADVYLGKNFRETALRRLAGDHYDQITTAAKPAETPEGAAAAQPVPINAALAATAFGMITPAPAAYRFRFGLTPPEGGRLMVHPDCELWLQPPANARRITWDFGILPAAYERDGGKTDGVEFIIAGESADGRRREIYHRLLDPAGKPDDRGPQHAVIPCTPAAGEKLVFLTRPNQNYAFDWAWWSGIKVE